MPRRLSEKYPERLQTAGKPSKRKNGCLGQEGPEGTIYPTTNKRASVEKHGCSFAYVTQQTQCTGSARIIAPFLNEGEALFSQPDKLEFVVFNQY